MPRQRRREQQQPNHVQALQNQREDKNIFKEAALEACRVGLTAILCTGGMVLGTFALCNQVKKPENMLEAWRIGTFLGATTGLITARLLKLTPKPKFSNIVHTVALSQLIVEGAKILFEDRVRNLFTASSQR